MNKVQLTASDKMNTPIYHLIVFGVFWLVLWNPEIVSLKIECKKINEEISENLHGPIDTQLNFV